MNSFSLFIYVLTPDAEMFLKGGGGDKINAREVVKGKFWDLKYMCFLE